MGPKPVTLYLNSIRYLIGNGAWPPERGLAPSTLKKLEKAIIIQ
jgi:hypothetical protein